MEATRLLDHTKLLNHLRSDLAARLPSFPVEVIDIALPAIERVLCDWLQDEGRQQGAWEPLLDDAAWRAVQRWATKAPGDAHNAAAAAVLADNGDKDALRLLAAELCDRCNSLADATGPLPPTPEGGGPRTSDGMLEIEAKLASWLERIDADAATQLRDASRKRLADHKAGKIDALGLFSNWPNDGEAVLELLAEAVWRARSTAKPIRLEGTSYQGDTYTTAPRSLGPMVWALGGAGRVVEVDGDQYGTAPPIARFLPKSHGILDTRRQRAPQTSIVFPVEVEPPTAIQVVGDAQFVLDPTAAKVALAMLTMAPADGSMVAGVMRELVELLNPGRRVQARDYKATAEALRDLRSLALVLPDDTAVSLFSDIRGPADPDNAKHDQAVTWSLSRAAQGMAAGKAGATLVGRFLFNFTGAMRLSARESAGLRAYLHTAATWNNAHPQGEARIDPARLPARTMDEWAATFNMLSAAAVEAMEGASGRQQRKRLSEDRVATRETLDKLEAEHQLIIIQKHGRDTYRLLPPDPLAEAYAMQRKRGARPE